MDEPIDVRARDAAEALLALGWPIVSLGSGKSGWQVGADTFTDEELLEFAAWAGVETSAER